jgi:hypothetical protein
MNKNTKGLAPILIILIIIGVLATAGGAYYFSGKLSGLKEKLPPQIEKEAQKVEEENIQNEQATGTEEVENFAEVETEMSTMPGKEMESLFFFDAHAHTSAASYSYDLSKVVKYLDTYSISKMILMQPPADFSKYQTPEEAGIPSAKETYPDRFLVFYQGEAIKLLQEAARRGNYTQEEENRFRQLIEEAAKSGTYAGFGEIALRHFPQLGLQGIRREARDITINGDHPWLLYLPDTAANYGMVLDIHIEPDQTTLIGFEKLISHNSKTKIIFDHAGWYNTGLGTASLFENLLSKYPNLYASIKIRKPANPEQLKVAIVGSNGEINKDWLNVFEKYPSRFVIGTDIKLGLEGEGENTEEIFSLTKKFLEKLTENLRRKIAWENANLIFNIK